MTRKKNRIYQINVHLNGAPADPLQLQARVRDRKKGHYELLHGSPLTGLVSGDMVTCEVGADGSRHLSGLEALRMGTLGVVTAVEEFCGHHHLPMIKQTAEDWVETGCRGIDVVDNGLIVGFWPSSVSRADAEMAVLRSAEEFDLTAHVAGLKERLTILHNMLSFERPGWQSAPTAA